MPVDMTAPNALRRFIDIGVEGTFRNDLLGVQQERDAYDQQGVNGLIQSYANRPRTVTRTAPAAQRTPAVLGGLPAATVEEPISAEEDFNNLVNTVGALKRYGAKGESAINSLIQTQRLRKEFMPKQSTRRTLDEELLLENIKHDNRMKEREVSANGRVKAAKAAGGSAEDVVAARQKEARIRELDDKKSSLQETIQTRYMKAVGNHDYEVETDKTGNAVMVPPAKAGDAPVPKYKTDPKTGLPIQKQTQYSLEKILKGEQPIPKIRVGDNLIEDPDVVNWIKTVHEYEAEMRQQGKEYKPARSPQGSASKEAAAVFEQLQKQGMSPEEAYKELQRRKLK